MRSPNSKAPSSASSRSGDGDAFDLGAYRDRLMSAVAREEAGLRTGEVFSSDALALASAPLMDAMINMNEAPIDVFGSVGDILNCLPKEETTLQPATHDGANGEATMAIPGEALPIVDSCPSGPPAGPKADTPNPSTASSFLECDVSLRTLATLSYDPDEFDFHEVDRRLNDALQRRLKDRIQDEQENNREPESYLEELWDTITGESNTDDPIAAHTKKSARSAMIDVALDLLRSGETCKDIGRAIGATPGDVYTWMWDAVRDGHLTGYEPVPAHRISDIKRRNGTRLRKIPDDLEFDTESDLYRRETKYYRSMMKNRSTDRFGAAGGFQPMRGTHPRRYGVGITIGHTGRHPGSDNWNVEEFIGPTIPAWIYGTRSNSYTPETKLVALSQLRSGASHLQVSRLLGRVSIATVYNWDREAIELGFLSPSEGVGIPRASSVYHGPVRPIAYPLIDFLPPSGKDMSTESTPTTEPDNIEPRSPGEPDGILSHWRPDNFSDGPERRLEFRIGEASRPSIAVTFSASPSVDILVALCAVIKQNILREPKDQTPILACSDDTIVPPILAAMNGLAAETERPIEIRSPSQTIELRD